MGGSFGSRGRFFLFQTPPSIFYSERNKESATSLRFSQRLGQELLNSGFSPTLHHAEKIEGENRELVSKEKGIYRFDDLIVLKKTEIPAVLLECGIILNKNEEKLLSNPAYQAALVSSITRAIEKFCQSGFNQFPLSTQSK